MELIKSTGQNLMSPALSLTGMTNLVLLRSSGLHSGELQPLAAAKGQTCLGPTFPLVLHGYFLFKDREFQESQGGPGETHSQNKFSLLAGV